MNGKDIEKLWEYYLAFCDGLYDKNVHPKFLETKIKSFGRYIADIRTEKYKKSSK